MIDKAQLYAQSQNTPAINKTDDKAALKEQTDKFESIIVKMLLDEAMPKEGALLPKSPGRDIYKSMYNDEMSKQLTGGFGFSQLLFDYLSQDDVIPAK